MTRTGLGGASTCSTLRDYYACDIVVRSPASLVVGNEERDRGDASRPRRSSPTASCSGKTSSGAAPRKRACSARTASSAVATHAGDGAYGQGHRQNDPVPGHRGLPRPRQHASTTSGSSGTRVQSCARLDGNPADYARHLIEVRGRARTDASGPSCRNPTGEGPYTGRGNVQRMGREVRERRRSNHGGGRGGRFASEYDRACQLEYPAGAMSGSSHELRSPILDGASVRAFLPRQFTIDHRIGRDDPLMPPRAALRWSLRGRHDGWGQVRRTPTGADVYLMGAARTPSSVRGACSPRVRALRRNRSPQADPAAHRPGAPEPPGIRPTPASATAAS